MYILPKYVKHDFKPRMILSGKVMKCVMSHKYLGLHITADRKDNEAIISSVAIFIVGVIR